MIKNYFLLLFSLFGTVLNLSAQQLSLTASKTSLAEGENATITATLSSALAYDIYIPFTSKGTALLGGDFTTNASTVITTAAGGNGSGSGSNQLSSPSKVGFDSLGNMYVLENNSVSKWAPNATSGTKIISFYYYASGMFVDKDGNIYLGNNNNYSIEKWAVGYSSGVKVAGGNGYGSSNDKLYNVSNFYVDSLENIYIADSNNHRVQKWEKGAITGVTVAGGNGSGSAANQLNNPNGVVVDANGTVFVCDSGNTRIQKWTAGASSGTTILSSTADNILGYGLEGLQVDAAGQIYLISYTSSYNAKNISKWNPVTKKSVSIAGTSTAGSGASQLDNPQGFYVDANGSVYVADTNNHRVQKYNYNNLLIKAGDKTAQLTVSSNGDIIEEVTEQILLKFETVPNVTITSVSEFQFELTDDTNTPKPISQGLYSTQNKYETVVLSATVDGDEALDYKITKLPVGGTLYQTSDGIALGNNISTVPALVTNKDHKVIYVPNWNPNDPDPDGFLFSVHNGNITSEEDGVITFKITKVAYPSISLAASKTTMAEGQNASITATLSEAIQYDVYIPFTSKGTAVIGGDFTTNGATVISTIAGGNGSGMSPNQLSYPRRVGLDGAGNTYVLDSNGVSKFAPNATTGTKIISNVYYSSSMAVDNDGNVYLGNNSSYSIEKWAPNASIGVVVAGGNGSGTNANQLSSVTNFCLDKSGNIYIADTPNYRVQKWNVGASKGVTVAGGNGSGSNSNQISSNIGVFVDEAGNVYLNDVNNNRIQKWAPGATVGTTVLSNSVDSYYGNTLDFIQVDAAGKIYLMTYSYGAIQQVRNITQVDPLTKKMTVLAGTSTVGSELNQLDTPQGYLLDSQGNLYIADSNNHRVQKYNYNNLLIKAGEKSAQLSIGAAMDIYEEPTEQISLMIEAVPHIILSGTSDFQIDITDNTNTPTAANKTIATAQNKYESIVLSGTAEGNVSLDYKITKLPTKGTLYQTVDGIALGAAISTVPTLITNPDHKVIFVPNWTTIAASTDVFTFSVTNGNIPNLADGIVSLTIEQASYPTLSVAASKASIAEGENSTLTATLTTVLPNDIYIPFTTKGTALVDVDYTTNSATAITTVGGGNGSGSAANQLATPRKVGFDAAGNMYVLDSNGVSKWAPNATSGTKIISNMYGIGTMFVDKDGNVYLGNIYNYSVDKWKPGATSAIVVAGGKGQGSAANQLSYISDIYVDKSNNIYVADYGNYRVQKWTDQATTGVTVAGGNGQGSAANQLSGANALFVDDNGTVFVNDSGNLRIQKWLANASSGTTILSNSGETILGNYIEGLQIDALGKIYLMSGTYSLSSNKSITKWDPVTKKGVVVAGNNPSGSAANQLDNPQGYYVDSQGDLYIADSNNYRVQKYGLNKIFIKAGEKSGQLLIGGSTDIFEEETEQIGINFGSVPNVTIDPLLEINIELKDNTNTPIPANKSLTTAQDKPLTVVLSGTAEGNEILDYKITKLPVNGTLYQTADGIVLGAAISTVPTLITNTEHKVIFVPNWATVVASTDEFTYSVNNGNIPNLADGIVSLAIEQTNYPVLSVTASKATIAEGENSTLTTNLTAALSNDIYIPFTTKGTALVDVDYTTNSTTAMTTVAGGNGSGGAANQLATPRKVGFDAVGNMYVLDSNGVSRWAPNATSGTRIVSSIYGIVGMFVDKDGTIYVGNNNNYSVDKYKPGTTTPEVVAGGKGSGTKADQFSYINDIYVDKSNAIYIADAMNARVQKWTAGAVSGTTVAGGNGQGNAANQLSGVNAIFVDDAGTVFVNDSGNTRIQKWPANATSGSTILSNNGESYLGNYIEGLQVDASGKIYLMSYNYSSLSNKTITKWDPITKKGVVVAGNNASGSAINQLDGPQGYYVDSQGDLYIADSNNHRVQKYSNNKILIKAGEKSGQLVISGAADIFEEETERITVSFGSVPHVTIDPLLEINIELKDNTNTPIAVDKSLITAQNKNAVIVLSGSADGDVTLSYKITKLPSNGTLYQTADGIALGNAIAVVPTLVTNADHKVIFVPTWTTVASSSDEFAFSVNNGNIPNLADGKVTLSINKADYPTLSLTPSKTSIAEHEKVTITATLSEAFPKDIYIPFESKGTATMDADFSTNAPTIISTVAGGNGYGAGANQLSGAQNVIVDASGNIYICDSSNHRIQKWAAGATSGVTVAGGTMSGSGANQLYYPRGIFVDAQGNIYIADSNNHRIVKWAPNATTGTTVAGGNGSGSAANQLNYPTAVYVDATGTMYIADQGNNRIQKWTKDATTGTTVAGGSTSGAAANQLSSPTSIYVDVSGNMYIADSYNYRIQKWAKDATTGTTVAGGFGNGSGTNQLSTASNVFVDAAGNVYVADTSNQRIQKWAPGATSGITALSSTSPGGGPTGQFYPSAVYIDGSGSMYISDSMNYRIQKYSNKSLFVKAGDTSGQLLVSAIEDNLETEGKETIVLNFGTVPQTTLTTSGLISIDLNDNTRTLTMQTENPFDGLEEGAVSWGDYDKDGDQDVAVMGRGISGVTTKVYINDNGVFRDSNQNFLKLYKGDISWVDINKDGWIDLVVSGLSAAGPKTVVYLNSNGKMFVDSTVFQLPQLYSSKMAWGDLDNDGDADLLISGIDETEKFVFKMMVNDKNQIFIEDLDFSKNNQGFVEGAIKIGDIDLDGDNDIVYSGKSSTGSPVQGVIYSSYIKTAITPNYSLSFLKNSSIEIAKINNSQNYLTYVINGVDNSGKFDCYSNNSLFTTTGYPPTTSKFPKLKNGDIAIADFNNDGTNDIVFTGENADGKGETKLFLQDASGNFSESPIVLEGMRNSTANWVDYDGDGDLDLFLTGYSSTAGAKSILYKSEIANKKNMAPAKVTGLVMTDGGNGKVKLSWNVPADDYSTNLGYEIRIGTTPGGSELACVDSNPQTGARLITNPASVYTNFYETQLNPGKYYWSVQAVDTGLKGGQFSEESSFTLTYDWKVLNQGGIIDRTISGTKTPIMKLVDLDNDNDMDLIFNNPSLGYGYNLLKYNGKQLVLDNSTPLGNLPLSGVEVGDFNGDGKADVLTATSSNSSAGGISINLSTLTGTKSVYLSDGLYKPKMRIVDINNDGQAEILVMGVTTNTGSGVPNLWVFNYDKATDKFTKTNVSSQIAKLSDASFDLGDFDKDQDVDFVLSGYDLDGGLKAIIYENVTTLGGDFTLRATANNVVGVNNGTTDFVDFDGDGDLDVIFTGVGARGNVFEIYINKVNENITTWPKLNTNLIPIRDGKIDFGDYNGDGYSDLLYSGLTDGGGTITKLCEYVPGELAFKESLFDVSDIINAEIEFGDIDGDKDLDFIITGESKTTPGSYIFRTYVNYRNDSAKVLAQSKRSAAVAGNDKPTVPTLPAESVIRLSSVSSKTGTYPVEISWNPATDDNTPSSGLTYALKIGTTDGGEQIMAANANSDGTRKISGKGNVEHSNKWRLSLPPGIYYYSVQAIDASFAGSEYSRSASFEIKAEGTLARKSFEKVPDLDILISPNPATDYVNVVAGEKLEIEKVELYDYLGKLIRSEKKETLSLHNLSRGVYVLKIYTSKGVVSRKIIKK